MKTRLVTATGISPNKVTVVSNTEEFAFSKHPIDNDVITSLKDQKIISYIGSYGPHRGLDTVIEAMRWVEDQTIKVLIVGQSSKETENRLRGLIKQYKLEDRVGFLGWQPFEKVTSYMKASTIGIIPHHDNEHTNNTIPHKLFQYMMMGVPVIVSTCPPLARIVSETDSGLIFESGNDKELAEKIRQLTTDHALSKKCALNGIDATVEGAYNWENESRKLINIYNTIHTKIV